MTQEAEAVEAMKRLPTFEQVKAEVEWQKDIYRQWKDNPSDPALDYWFQSMKRQGWTKREMAQRLGREAK